MSATRNSAFGVVVAVAAFAFVGCGPATDCSLVPPLNHAPASCTLPPDTTVTVDVRWCDCDSSVRCDVTFDGGSYLLEPRVTACDAQCPDNPASCNIDSTVSCVFRTEPLGTDNSYGVQIADGSGIRSATFNIANGGDDTCGP